MNTNKAIHYTDAGRKRLVDLQDDLLRQIESELRERRYVPGDEEIEVTAADVDDLSRSMSLRFYTRDQSRLYFRDLVMRIYMVCGLLLAAVGIFYPYIRTKVFSDPTQTTLVVTGVGTVFASYLMRVYFQRLDIRREQWRHELDRLSAREVTKGDGD